MDTHYFIDGNDTYAFTFYRVENDLFISMSCVYGYNGRNGFFGLKEKFSQFIEDYKNNNYPEELVHFCHRIIKNIAFL